METRTASADVTQPEHARQSVRDISAGGAVVDFESELKLISCSLLSPEGPEGLVGRVSTGLIHATEGVMKSDKSSAESIALMAKVAKARRAADSWG